MMKNINQSRKFSASMLKYALYITGTWNTLLKKEMNTEWDSFFYYSEETTKFKNYKDILKDVFLSLY